MRFLSASSPLVGEGDAEMPKHRFGPRRGHTGRYALDFERSRMRSDEGGEGAKA